MPPSTLQLPKPSTAFPLTRLHAPPSQGLNPYSERINGRIAVLGLSALLMVELATGQGVINYHSPAIVFIQVYFVAALYVKYQKEKVSVWPQ